MNKQVVSFLSLFSLVLVLSIYYVMIPASRENIKNVDNQISSNNEELTIDNASNLFFTTLQENRKTRHDEVKNTQIDILASDQYTNQQKLEARNKLTHEELLETTETGNTNQIIRTFTQHPNTMEEQKYNEIIKCIEPIMFTATINKNLEIEITIAGTFLTKQEHDDFETIKKKKCFKWNGEIFK